MRRHGPDGIALQWGLPLRRSDARHCLFANALIDLRMREMIPIHCSVPRNPPLHMCYGAMTD